nr:MAG TPA: hypothetical protein [Caudoviricetes sp.]
MNFISSRHLIISQIPKFTETFYHDAYFQSDSHTKKEYIKELPTILSNFPTIIQNHSRAREGENTKCD